MTLLDVNRHHRGLEAGVSHWAFDDAAGRISARDSHGNLVMAIATGPLFGVRMAAAFSSPTATSYATSLAVASTPPAARL
jgi:hypothetical protein